MTACNFLRQDSALCVTNWANCRALPLCRYLADPRQRGRRLRHNEDDPLRSARYQCGAWRRYGRAPCFACARRTVNVRSGQLLGGDGDPRPLRRSSSRQPLQTHRQPDLAVFWLYTRPNRRRLAHWKIGTTDHDRAAFPADRYNIASFRWILSIQPRSERYRPSQKLPSHLWRHLLRRVARRT